MISWTGRLSQSDNGDVLDFQMTSTISLDGVPVPTSATSLHVGVLQLMHSTSQHIPYSMASSDHVAVQLMTRRCRNVPRLREQQLAGTHRSADDSWVPTTLAAPNSRTAHQKHTDDFTFSVFQFFCSHITLSQVFRCRKRTITASGNFWLWLWVAALPSLTGWAASISTSETGRLRSAWMKSATAFLQSSSFCNLSSFIRRLFRRPYWSTLLAHRSLSA